MDYVAKANEIILNSIKSAIFIDEKAKSFFSSESDDGNYEEKLSVELFEKFKSKGISLAIHKFVIGDEESDLGNYLFDNRDLVLLDWRLDGEEGEEYALKMLSKIVKSPHIHFCVIYTSEPNLDNVYTNISTYFSGKSSSFYKDVLSDFEAYQDVFSPIFDKFNLLDDSKNGQLVNDMMKIEDGFLNILRETTGINNPVEAFKQVKIAFSRFHKSDVSLNYPLSFSTETNTLSINNTIVTIVSKEADADSDANTFIDRFARKIINSSNSYTQLLGLEMQSLFLKRSSFIDSNFIDVSKETIAYHRKQLMDGGEDDIPFRQLMKRIFLEHASLGLSTMESSLLSPDLMKVIDIPEPPNTGELASMNVFYNSVKLSIDGKKLDFGDVFQNDKGDFYICITALCDCIRPAKNDYIFYFAKGINIPIDRALRLGDTSFISFISKEKSIIWSNIDNVGLDDDGNPDLSQFRYKPVYIKPQSFLVEEPLLDKGTIEIAKIFQYERTGGNLDFEKINYMTTIKPNYTQRIANHAFSHPIRVGVDFVKKQ